MSFTMILLAHSVTVLKISVIIKLSAVV